MKAVKNSGSETYKSSTDVELIQFIKVGIRSAFNELVERYAKKIHKKVYKLVRNSTLTEIITQEILVDLWHRKHTLEAEKFLDYLSTSVKYHVYLMYETKTSTQILDDPLNHFVMAIIEAESALSIEKIKKLIKDWLITQPKDRRQIFNLKYKAKFSSKEICERLGIPLHIIQDQLNISRVSLNKHIHKYLVMNLD